MPLRAAGIIVEYNPFHNGHLYHLQQTKKQTQADIIIAVMSGDFLQRGEPALLSKWTRTTLALKAGVDLVVELPYAYATQKAEVFAWGAVCILADLGVTDIVFGSEAGDIEPFHRTVRAMESRKAAFDRAVKAHTALGVSYPKAASFAFRDLGLSGEEYIDLSQPNNILGYHYVDAVRRLGRPIQTATVKRLKADYHDNDIRDDRIASATAIRQALFAGSARREELRRLVPPYTADALFAAQDNGTLRSWEDYFPFLKYRLLTARHQELSAIYEAEEGLENRLKAFALRAANFKEWMELIKTKRYTWTRLQRLATHVLTGATKEEMAGAGLFQKPPYIRLLGMNGKGQKYLNRIKKDLKVPIITKIASSRSPVAALDERAALCYRLIKPSDDRGDFDRSPVRYDEASGRTL